MTVEIRPARRSGPPKSSSAAVTLKASVSQKQDCVPSAVSEQEWKGTGRRSACRARRVASKSFSICDQVRHRKDP
jgi:hypothetical protein